MIMNLHLLINQLLLTRIERIRWNLLRIWVLHLYNLLAIHLKSATQALSTLTMLVTPRQQKLDCLAWRWRLLGSAKKDGTLVPPTGDEDECTNSFHDDVYNETTTFANDDVFTQGGFVNMDTHPYAWAKAFPSVFIPVYAGINGVLGWHITHDYTGWLSVRDHTITFSEWVESMIWADDGRFASHSTIALVVFNHHMKMKVNGQGRYCLNESGLDPGLLIKEIEEMTDDDSRRTAIKSLLEHATIHSRNIPGTPMYQRGTYYQFKATDFFQNYIMEKDSNAFHTGSLAKYHDPFLREISKKYRCLTASSS